MDITMAWYLWFLWFCSLLLL